MLPRTSPVEIPEHEQHWVQTVRDLAHFFAKTVAEDDRSARLPVDHLTALSSSGLDVAFLPAEHGGESLSYATLGAVVRTIAAAHPALAAVWLMHIGAAHALVSTSPPEAAEFFAAELRAGRRFANALSEPAGGNYFLSSQQDVPAVEGGWSFTGRKMFVSGAEAADHLMANVRVDGHPAFFGVSVDDTVTFPPIDLTSGMRATRSRSIAFDGTLLRADRLCAPPAADYANLISVGFSFISVGIAESALAALADYATARPAGPGLDGTLADASWVRMEVGITSAEVRAACLVAERTAWLADRRDPAAMPSATEAKMYANEVAKRAAATAVKVGGGSGYLEKSPIQRIFRDAQAGAVMAYSVPFSQEIVGGWALERAV
ncbi:acyl-CoA dehydrogenase family protein [Galbitalea soli]|uniref:Acyl-CoA/acyl-ACP dehydrogenase n=1 Tax=Galbitalea soli TaxID=1268042 RepID=A0A7C9TQY8_9MICO|nr:acyl-CoA dehydrogenase family protein [Galbitalea soli]NEM91495.1 acyl-CoA/acyl-ACP dehydrogenase [Galbitalea soli]NYJ30188.1 alkylation response protein AidB-like acyl-CoA dehydrogenase [Galbitalea soli]